MNFSSYGNYYGKFHRGIVSAVHNGIMVLDFTDMPWETWFVSRLHNSAKISINADKPLLKALKTFFKTDVPASVFCKESSFTVLLGNERLVIPVSGSNAKFHLYATPYYLNDPQIVANYLEGYTRPAYEHVYPYKNTILFLDNCDLPYPGGCYFDKSIPTSYYRICFLTNESLEYVSTLVSEWHSRQDVFNLPHLAREVVIQPKFIQFQVIGEPHFQESDTTSTGIIHKHYSREKPELLFQDILESYFHNLERFNDSRSDYNNLGLIVPHPVKVIFDGVRTYQNQTLTHQSIALAINGNHPSRVVLAREPFDRFFEFKDVPATIVWTPIYYERKFLETELDIEKVVIDATVIGFNYRGAFFCLDKPLLEGRPAPQSLINTQCLLSIVTDLTDKKIQVVETFRYDSLHSLHRVHLRGLTFETWCLTKASDSDPYTKAMHLPYLVQEWLAFFKQLEKEVLKNVNVSTVRLALTLSRHKICYRLINDCKKDGEMYLTEQDITFYLKDTVIDFINEARIGKAENTHESSCTIS